MKKGWKIALGIGVPALAVGGVLAYRSLLPPKFLVESVDDLSKSGRFTFGGADNSFGIGNSGSVGGRGGWTLNYSTNPTGLTVFDLWKNGKKVRELKQIQFN